MSKVATLEVMLHDTLVGYLTHYPDERTTFVVDESYIEYGTGHKILETWEDVYRQKHVPETLIDKVRSHQDGLTLTRELRFVQS